MYLFLGLLTEPLGTSTSEVSMVIGSSDSGSDLPTHPETVQNKKSCGVHVCVVYVHLKIEILLVCKITYVPLDSTVIPILNFKL